MTSQEEYVTIQELNAKWRELMDTIDRLYQARGWAGLEVLHLVMTLDE